MVKDAEAHATEDKKRREQVEAKNQADALVHTTEKSVKEYGDKVSAADRTAIENAIAELKEALKGDDVDAIRSKAQVLAQASMKLGEAMYAAQKQGGDGDAGGAPGDSGAKKEDVVDAEFTEVDDDKKNKKSA
jgi:molecular chaperone DnaK